MNVDIKESLFAPLFEFDQNTMDGISNIIIRMSKKTEVVPEKRTSLSYHTLCYDYLCGAGREEIAVPEVTVVIPLFDEDHISSVRSSPFWIRASMILRLLSMIPQRR